MSLPAIPGNKWLAIIMPLHDGERWIEATLGSLVGEADGGVEIIAIDSSASERTAALAGHFSDRLDLTIIRRPDVPGWHAKMNLAVEMAAARHVCMLHQDDLWLPGRLDKMRKWLTAYPDAALHLAPTMIIDEAGRKLGEWHCPLPAGPLDGEDLASRLLVQNFVSVPSPVFTRDAWLGCGGMDEALWYTCDWDIWLKLGASGQAVYHREVTTAFRIHGSSLTMTGSRQLEDFEAQMRTVFDRHAGMLKGDWGPTYKAALASIALNVALAAASRREFGRLGSAFAHFVRLGPMGLARFLRYSKIVERVLPRVRARLAGAF